MKFEVHLAHQNTDPLVIEANNWFIALQSALRAYGEEIQMAHLNFTLLEDGESAEITEQNTGNKFKAIALPDDDTTDTTIPSFIPLDKLPKRIKISTITNTTFKLTPQPKPESFSLDGHYAPGATEDSLTDMFMKMSDLQQHFRNNRRAALQYVLNTLFQSIKAVGGGILLTDINSSEHTLWVELAMGEGAALLSNMQFPSGQGLVGHCAQHGVSLNLANLQTDPLFPDELLRDPALDIGPCICVPIQHNSQLRGVLLLFKHPKHRPFTDGEFSVFSYLSSHIGEYLDSSNEP